jgi:hypothetical protein
MRKPFKPSPGRVLCWTHKYGTCLVFARTPAEDLAAYLMLFQAMDAQNYYWDIWEDADAGEWHQKAKGGDGEAARTLLGVRSEEGYEYETVEVQHIDTPPAKQPELADFLYVPGDPSTLPPHIIELATKYGDSPEHTKRLLERYARGDSLTVLFHPQYTRASNEPA